MSQRVTQREIATVRQLDEQRAGLTGTVQCDGCPDQVRVLPGRPGHRSTCDLCSRHCTCFRIPDGIDADSVGGEPS